MATAERSSKIKSKKPQPHSPRTVTAISFSSCGWLKLYNFGVAKALAESELVDVGSLELLGSSGGALTAVGLLLELDFDEIAAFALECVERTHGSLRGAFRLRTYLSECLDLQFAQYARLSRWEDRPQEVGGGSSRSSSSVGSSSSTRSSSTVNSSSSSSSSEVTLDVPGNSCSIEDSLADRITVSVTTLPWLRKRRYSNFRDLDHVKNVLIASCTATPLAGWPFKLDGDWVIDGGLADFQPLSDTRHTVTVSPFYCSNADIRPSRYVPLWWALYPPRREDFEWVYLLGFDDARSWLQRLHSKSKKKRETLERQQMEKIKIDYENQEKDKHQNGTCKSEQFTDMSIFEKRIAKTAATTTTTTRRRRRRRRSREKKTKSRRKENSNDTVDVLSSCRDEMRKQVTDSIASRRAATKEKLAKLTSAFNAASSSSSMPHSHLPSSSGDVPIDTPTTSPTTTDQLRFPSDASRTRWAFATTSLFSRRQRPQKTRQKLSSRRRDERDHGESSASEDEIYGAGEDDDGNNNARLAWTSASSSWLSDGFFRRPNSWSDLASLGRDAAEEGDRSPTLRRPRSYADLVRVFSAPSVSLGLLARDAMELNREKNEEEEEEEERKARRSQTVRRRLKKHHLQLMHPIEKKQSRIEMEDGDKDGGRMGPKEGWDEDQEEDEVSHLTDVTISPTTPQHETHPTHTYAAAWPYKILKGGSRQSKGKGACFRSDSKLSEKYSFQRVFGYRSVLKLFPAQLLDFLLIFVVFVIVQPTAFFLVYVELLLRAVLLSIVSCVSLLRAVSIDSASFLVESSTSVLFFFFRKKKDSPTNSSSTPHATSSSSTSRQAHSSNRTHSKHTAILKGCVKDGTNGDFEHKKTTQNHHHEQQQEQQQRSLREAARTHRRLERDQRRRLLATLSAIVSPTLLVRAAVPFLGKPLTGDAYRLRRSLCELSFVYRICVHFL